MDWKQDFKENSIYRIGESTRMINIAFNKLESHCHPDPVQGTLWLKPNKYSNSIGNLILHLCGNMTQYVIASLGEKVDSRNRDQEFLATEVWSKSELLHTLQSTVTEVVDVIHNASEEQLLKKRRVQGFYFSGMGCVIHAVEHYSYHTGQIAFWVKQRIDRQLGFYDGMDLNSTKDDN